MFVPQAVTFACTQELVLAKPITLKPEEIAARGYADRLILQQLTEMDSAIKLGELADRLSTDGLGLAAVRSLLASNPDRFVHHERRWIPAARVEGMGRPLAEIIRMTVERFGGPMPIGLINQEVLRTTGREFEIVEAMVQRIVMTDDQFVVTEDERIALTEWAFGASHESDERAFALWPVDLEAVNAIYNKIKDRDWRKAGFVTEVVTEFAPVNVRVLGAALWKTMNSPDPRSVLMYDARNVLREIVSVPGYVYGADGMIAPQAEAKKWLTLAVKVAEKLAPTVDVEDAAPIEVKVDDVKRIVKKIQGSEESVTATKILEEFYEITPSNKTFPDDLANVIDALRGDANVWWVGADRFRTPKSAPDFVYEVPEVFNFVESDIKDEDGELVDVELNDDGLSSTLRKLLIHPLATDVLDEDVIPAQKLVPDRVRLVLKSIHRELGTFPLCQLPTGYLDPNPAIQELIFIDPNGRELQVWVNNDARLMYNLIDWWYEQSVESGAVFTITKTNKPNVFEFAWEDQTDPVVYISTQRMEELRQLQLTTEGGSTLSILIEVMHHWPKGTDFLTLLAEVNVVRRSSRRLIASLLSSYQCFYQRSGSPLWHFDNKKVELGFDKTKRKFVKK